MHEKVSDVSENYRYIYNSAIRLYIFSTLSVPFYTTLRTLKTINQYGTVNQRQLLVWAGKDYEMRFAMS